MNRRDFLKKSMAFGIGMSLFPGMFSGCSGKNARNGKPNIILIYTDDLGYGDISCYGAKSINTPNIDRLATEGLRFTNAYATAATCTPSRYSLLTGEYAWRRDNTGIAAGDAPLIIDPTKKTLPKILKEAGYFTAVVGKWHLGLGNPKPDWNGELRPGPEELGFDYSFLIPATNDRVPCVFVENQKVVGLKKDDPIQVSFAQPIGDEPTGLSHPQLLKVKADTQHSGTIINGISRIGWMTGGKEARWVDEEIADLLTSKVESIIKNKKNQPFFLYFSLHDIHVPRMPHPRFQGKSKMGLRGDAILEADWCVGKVLETLEQLGLQENTMVIFSSDNGPVLHDGYFDQAIEKVGNHKPADGLSGGKYSSLEGGTRVPFIVWWPQKIKPGISDALFSQVDLCASFASFTGQKLEDSDCPDSIDMWPTLIGQSKKSRPYVIEEAIGRRLSIRRGQWKYIPPTPGPEYLKNKYIKTGWKNIAQLFDVEKDPGETTNIAEQYPDTVENLADILKKVRENNDRFLLTN